MKKILKHIFCVYIMFVFCGEVFAAFPSQLTSISQKSESYTTDAVGYGTAIKQSKNGYDSFCTLYYETTPASGSVSCSLDSNSWSPEIKAGVASIIKSYNSSSKTLHDFLKAELTINYFLYNYNGNKADNKIFEGSINKNWYKAAVTSYNSVENIINNISVSIGTISIKDDDNNFYLSTTVTTNSVDNYTASINVSGATVRQSGNKIDITIPKSSLIEGDNTVIISVKASNVEKIAQNYNCGVNYQTITPIHIEDAVVATANISKPIKVTKSSKGTLIIKKQSITYKDKKPETLIQGTAEFQIYKGIRCIDGEEVGDKVTTSGGQISIKNLDPGNYSIKEVKAPQGYDTSIERTCVIDSVTINPGENTVYVYNTPGCQVRLNELKDKNEVNKTNLMKLLKDFPANTKLLNFDNPSCAPVTNNDCNFDESSGCLSGKLNLKSAEFNENNLSCYNDTYDIYGNTAYCLTTFKIDNKIGNKWKTSAGSMLFSIDDPAAAAVHLEQVCYLFDSEILEFNGKKYSDYLSDVTLKINNLEALDDTNSSDEQLVLKQDSNIKEKYSGVIDVNYFLKPVYLKIGSGEVSETECDNCRFLGYGIISKLINNNLDMPFSFKFKDKFKDNEYNGICNYEVYEKLITKEGNLNLEFRTIDVSNPFVGKTGNGREPGNNWCFDRVTDSVMNERNNSSNKLNSEPLYTIVLTPDEIKQIRNYNKDVPYDKFEVECKNGVCENKFLNDTNIFGSNGVERNYPEWETNYKIPESIMGDVNNDGQINSQDIVMFNAYIENNGKSLCVNKEMLDINEDGNIDSLDISALWKYVSGETGSLK